MRVIMTGSSGFIGMHLYDELTRHGYEVIRVDRERSSDEVPEDLYGRTVLCDIAEPGAFAELLDTCTRGDNSVDAIVHLAAQVGREFGEDDLARTINWNATATALVAHAAGKQNIPVLYTSTSEVYGDLGSQTAWDGPNATMNLPHNLYGLSKRWGEEALQLYAPSGLKIARLSMPYGPGAPPGRGRRAMDNFLWQAYHHMPITVHRGAERSWCWVGDTVRALRLILEGDKTGSWNVGRDDDARSMLELAEISCQMTGASPSLIQVVDPPGMQTVVKRLSTARLREDFDWKPTVELEEGMEHVFRWVQNFDKDGRNIWLCPVR